MATLAEMLAARRAPVCTLAEAAPVEDLSLYCLLYERLLQNATSFPWDEQEDILHLFVHWLGVPASDPACAPLTNSVGLPYPHWSQIDHGLFRFAAMLLPADAYYVEIQNLTIRLWSTYRELYTTENIS